MVLYSTSFSTSSTLKTFYWLNFPKMGHSPNNPTSRVMYGQFGCGILATYPGDGHFLGQNPGPKAGSSSVNPPV